MPSIYTYPHRYTHLKKERTWNNRPRASIIVRLHGWIDPLRARHGNGQPLELNGEVPRGQAGEVGVVVVGAVVHEVFPRRAPEGDVLRLQHRLVEVLLHRQWHDGGPVRGLDAGHELGFCWCQHSVERGGYISVSISIYIYILYGCIYGYIVI